MDAGPVTGAARGEDRIIVVGAGLAGLVCAVNLLAAEKRVLLLEAADTVGGRVRTTVTNDGFRMDHGFQVLFTAYPALRRYVPIAALRPKYFAAGIQLMSGGGTTVLGHPIFNPGAILSSITARKASMSDVLALSADVLAALPLGDRSLPAAGRATRRALEESGASRAFIQGVIAPLFGGISLDRSLSSDHMFWRFVLRSMVLGRAFVPAFGVGQLTAALAAGLPPKAIRLNTAVTELLRDGQGIQGVVAGNESIRAPAVVLATDAPTAQRLTGLPLPQGSRACTTAYFASDAPVVDSRYLILNSDRSLVNHAVQISKVAPAYAPYGQHLFCATALDALPGGDEEVAEAMWADVNSWLPDARRARPRTVGVIRVPYAQFEQPPGVYASLPSSATVIRGLYLAGEYLHSSSVQGAMRGGEMAAAAVLGNRPSG